MPRTLGQKKFPSHMYTDFAAGRKDKTEEEHTAVREDNTSRHDVKETQAGK